MKSGFTSWSITTTGVPAARASRSRASISSWTLSTPVLAVITVLSFKDIWNMFFEPLLYLNSSTKYTVSIGLAYFNGQFTVDTGALMAASVVMLIPVIIVFFIAQKAFVEGISLTGLAGR